jgi:hypothetical protein
MSKKGTMSADSTKKCARVFIFIIQKMLTNIHITFIPMNTCAHTPYSHLWDWLQEICFRVYWDWRNHHECFAINRNVVSHWNILLLLILTRIMGWEWHLPLNHLNMGWFSKCVRVGNCYGFAATLESRYAWSHNGLVWQYLVCNIGWLSGFLPC